MECRKSRWVQEDHELRQTAGRQVSAFTNSMSTLSPKIVRYKKQEKTKLQVKEETSADNLPFVPAAYPNPE